MSIETDIDIKLYCEECGHEVEPKNIVCKDCFDDVKSERDQLQGELDDAEDTIRELEDSPR